LQFDVNEGKYSRWGHVLVTNRRSIVPFEDVDNKAVNFE